MLTCKTSVSVIVPVYNVEKYILKCITSISEQTYEGPIECILVDDCGSDNSIAVAKDFISSYKGKIQFKIIHRESNGGLSVARNTGINNSNGEYVYFLDSDDYISPNTIDKFVELTDKYPGVEMVQGRLLSVDENGIRPYLSLHESKLPSYTKKHSFIHDVILKNNLVPETAVNRLIRRDFILKNDLFFYEGIINEDNLWTFKLAQKLHSVAFLHEDTYYYVQREGSIVNNDEYRKKHIISFARNLSILIDYCDKTNRGDYLADTFFCFNLICNMMRVGGKECWEHYIPIMAKLKKKASNRSGITIQKFITSPQLIYKTGLYHRYLMTLGWPLYIQYRNDTEMVSRILNKFKNKLGFCSRYKNVTRTK